ncbi:MAG TPA: RimK/LysX family protein [Pseudomonadales bacterium]
MRVGSVIGSVIGSASGFVPVALVWLIAVSACAPIPPAVTPNPADKETVDALRAEVTRQAEQLATMQTTLADIRSQQNVAAGEFANQNQALARVEGAVTTLPESLKGMCAPPTPVEAQCKEPQIERVMISGTKMVVGDLEQVWIEPPGIALDARIDTTASSNLLRAESIVEFERDGQGWVRFGLRAPDATTAVTVEQRVARHVRATGAVEGAKRPVVQMQVRLGDVRDSFWFILTDRAEASHQVLLGRSFLKDIAIVDVGARYVQPRANAASTRPADSSTP